MFLFMLLIDEWLSSNVPVVAEVVTGAGGNPARVAVTGAGSTPAPVAVTGAGLTPADVRAVARDGAPVSLTPEVRARAERAWRTVTEIAAVQPVYGRGTGVGANRDVDVTALSDDEHGRRILRSHA